MSCASLPDTDMCLAATFLRLASDARRLALHCQGTNPTGRGDQIELWTAPDGHSANQWLFADPYKLTRPDERIRLRFADKSWQISRSPLWI